MRRRRASRPWPVARSVVANDSYGSKCWSLESGVRWRQASRRLRRSSRGGGCWSAATSPTTTSTRPSARPSTAAACSPSRGCPAASSTHSSTGPTGALYVTLDSARTWCATARAGAARLDARDRSGACGLARRRLRGRRARGAVALGGWRRRAGRGCPSPATRSRWPPRPLAGSTSSPRCPKLAWSDDYGATWHTSGPRATIVASDPRNDRVWYAVAPDGELLVSIDGGHSWWGSSCSAPSTGRAASQAGRRRGAPVSRSSTAWRVVPLEDELVAELTR